MVSGTSYTLYPGISQILDGSESTDVDKQPLNYLWEVTSTPNDSAVYTLTDSTTKVSTFSALTTGNYAVTLSITDEYNLTDSQTIDILVANNPPVAVAGAGATRYPGVQYTLSGSATDDDPDGTDSLTYNWSVVSAPGADGTYTLSGAATPTPTFVTDYYAAGAASYTTPSYIGSYTLRLTVTDEYGLTDTDDVTITVANLPPTASMSSSVPTPAVNNSTTLDCSSSSDPDSDRRQSATGDLHYSWSVIDSPVGSQWQWDTEGYGTNTDFIPAPVTTQTVDFTPNNVGNNNGEGVYTVRLTVTDEYGSTDTDTVVIPTSGNTAPALSAIDNIVSVTGDTRHGAGTNDVVDAADGTKDNDGPYRDNDAQAGESDASDTFSLNASDSITNTDNDTLTYTWTFGGFAGTIDIFVEGSLRTLGPGEVIATGGDSILTLAPNGAATPDGTADFSVTVKVSDGQTSKDDTAVMWFDLY